jgi:OsmC-like protein.
MKETTVHIFRDKERHIAACQLEDSKNIIFGFSLDDAQLTPLHMLNIALGQCIAELALRFLERRNLKSCCLTSIRMTVKNTGSARIECADVILKLPLQLSAEDETILVRILHQCPIHSAISGSVSTRIFICDGREPIAQYEQDLLTNIK